jgi:hypothetical protein
MITLMLQDNPVRGDAIIQPDDSINVFINPDDENI